MVGISRRDFMKGSLVGGVLNYAVLGFGNGYGRVWSEEVEDEARLRNEVSDLIREKDSSVVYSYSNEDGKHCNSCYDEKKIVYAKISIKCLNEARKQLLTLKKRAPFSGVRMVSVGEGSSYGIKDS